MNSSFELLYHVIVRGNQTQRTFLNDADCQAYLERLRRYRKRYGYKIHAYCLMPNHVHLAAVAHKPCRGCYYVIKDRLPFGPRAWQRVG